MSHPTMNVELLDATMAHIAAHPEAYNAEKCRTPTTMDFAGHAITLSGQDNWRYSADHRWAHLLTPLPEDDWGHDVKISDPDGGNMRIVTKEDAALMPDPMTNSLFVLPQARASRILGLNEYEVDVLTTTWISGINELRELLAEVKSGQFRNGF